MLQKNTLSCRMQHRQAGHVISTQVDALTPSVAPLLFVTTRVAETRFVETCRFIFPFICLHLLPLPIAFFPTIASWLPHLFLGWEIMIQPWRTRRRIRGEAPVFLHVLRG
jgi:hypothetical protein